MTTIKLFTVTLGLLGLFASCSSKRKPAESIESTADFSLGKIRMINKVKPQADGHELTLMTRYELKKNGLGPELSNYFQYQLGGKIKLLVGNDTIEPSLFYYVPLANELQKEIDCKYVLQAADLDKPKRVIIQDSILEFNKVDISLK
jgi:hypothetical protein